MPTIAGYTTTEKIFESPNTAIFCAHHPETRRTVVLKLLKGDHPENEAVSRLKQEYTILSSFDSPYIIKTYGLEQHHNSLVMVLEDCHKDFTSLAELIQGGRLELKAFITIAIEITRALEIVHNNNVIYRDLNPANILVNTENSHVKFIDFNISTGFIDDNGETAATAPLEGTLPYISPEQTGRLNTAIDYRTDFYSLGATLFELATGSLPFKANGASEIIHSHLAQKPQSPNRIIHNFPTALSAIILKLLEKSAPKRYQHCRGILSDLKRCLSELTTHGAISQFPPGEYNLSNILNIPSQLYCRKKQLNMLSTGLRDIGEENAFIVMLSGQSGVGKSALALEFKKSLLRENAYFIQGSFEADTSGIPYAAISSSLRQLIRQVLSENSASIHRWKKNVLRVLNGEGQILTDIIPELVHILGPQPHPAELNPVETERRFTRILQKFIQAICHTGPPLVMFLDDLHEADQASLKILERILTSSDLSRLLFIGAYRAEEKHIDEPLQHFIEALSAGNVQALQLENLQQHNIEQILHSALHIEKNDVANLASVCFQKTGGNPFYLKQFLYSIHRDGSIWYSPQTQRWEWDEAAIQNKLLTENIADLLIQGVETLPSTTRELLQTASCLGTVFGPEHLSILHDESIEDIETELHSALQAGFILNYENDPPPGEEVQYQFAHEQIRQAIHSRLIPTKKQVIHLSIGTYLLNTAHDNKYQQILYEVASHMNKGSALVSSRDDKLRIARINLDAAHKAKLSASSSAAHSYSQAGLQILPKESWQTDYDLSLALHENGCQSAYFCQDYRELERLFHETCAHAVDLFDTCKVYSLRIRALNAQNQPEEAVANCLNILRLLGIDFPSSPGKKHIISSFILTTLRLAAYNHDKLLSLPEMKDEKVLIIMGLLRDLGTVAYSAAPKLLPLISAQAIRLSLKHGNCLDSALIGYMIHGFLLCSFSGNHINTGYSFGQLAIELQKRISTGKTTFQPFSIHSRFIRHWKEHIRDTLPELKRAIKGCQDVGDFASSADIACSCSFRLYLLGTNLNRAKNEIEGYYSHIQQLGQQPPLNRLKIYRQAISNLLGENEDPTVIKGKYYNEDMVLPIHPSSVDYAALCQLQIVRLIHCVIFNRYAEALECSEKTHKYLVNITASVFVPVYYFYDSLARLANYDTCTPFQKLKTRLIVYKNQQKMRIWAHHAPQNYSHKFSLVEAELERIRGNSERAMEWYDKAIHLAKENEYLQEEAIAYELAARFYQGRGKAHIARPYMREARYCYHRWGATAKICQLDNQEWWTGTSNDKNTDHVSPDSITVSNTLIPEEGGSRLDMMTVIKASRILSSEMVLDELLKKMMRIMLESAGAQRGFLIFRENDAWMIKVRSSIYRSSIVTLTDTPVTSQNIASASIINYVIHAAVDVVLNDACKEGLFTNDSYILQKKPRSILCMPIIHQGEVFCILYLENNLATGAFPPDRQELLHLLGTQAAISLKNSRLFEKLECAVGELNTEVEKRRNTQLQLLHAEKLSALGRLSASIAHEFGNPLMGVKYLLDDFHKRENKSENDQQLLQLGLDECERMKKLIHDLQRFNKPSTGQHARIDVHRMIDNVLLFQKKHFSTNRIRLQKHYDQSVPEVEVIVDQITQVLFNLTMNAVDAMMEDGGILTVSTKKKNGELIIEVTDTGSGICHDDQNRIFEPFYSTKTEEDGTGLGLSISYGIVKHHKGHLSFVSRPDVGTTFTISLPAIPEKVII